MVFLPGFCVCHRTPSGSGSSESAPLCRCWGRFRSRALIEGLFLRWFTRSSRAVLSASVPLSGSTRPAKAGRRAVAAAAGAAVRGCPAVWLEAVGCFRAEGSDGERSTHFTVWHIRSNPLPVVNPGSFR